MPVLEHSVIEFVERWKHQAANVTLYPNTEASLLLEVQVGGRVLYLMDRTGPYNIGSGPARVIVHPVAETVIHSDAHDEMLQPIGVSRIEATGRVLEVEQGFVIVQARAPLVVGVFDDSWKRVTVGQMVSFESLEPLHGFVLGKQ
jgi:hypothetical protein